MGGEFSYGNSFDGLTTTNFDFQYTPPTPEQVQEMAQIVAQQAPAIVNPLPTPDPVPYDPWEIGRLQGMTDYEINQWLRGSEYYRESVFDRFWSSPSGVSPYVNIPPNKNIESYVVFYDGPTKYYTGSANIDEFRRLGYTISRDPTTYEWTALLYKEQLQADVPPVQYIPADELPTWTDDMGRDPAKNIPNEVEVEIPDLPIVPPPLPADDLDSETTYIERPNNTPLYVLGGAVLLLLLTRK